MSAAAADPVWRVGLIGYGAIGQSVARLLLAQPGHALGIVTRSVPEDGFGPGTEALGDLEALLDWRPDAVIEAASAEEALDLLRDPEIKVNVFVTDVVMPGLDGPSWVRQALEDRPEVKVVFVSGYAQESFHDDQAAIPNSPFLPKPFSLVELTDTVQRQLH